MPRQTLFYEQVPDNELLDLSAQDDLTAFDILYARHRDHLVTKARALFTKVYGPLAPRQLAEDLVQDILMDLFERRHTVEVRVPLRAYLYKSVKYKVLNQLRADRVQRRQKQLFFLSQLCKIDCANYAETRELDYRINDVLARLSPKCKRVFLLSRAEDTSHKVISERLNISVSTVEKHVVKALKTMRNSLTEYI